MYSVKNATKQLNTPAWHWRQTEKLSAARQPSKIGCAHELAAAA